MAGTVDQPPKPWQAVDGKILDSDGNEIGSYALDNEFSQRNGMLMAAAPALVSNLGKSIDLIKLTVAILNSIIRHEIHSYDLITTLADLTDTLKRRQTEIEEILSKYQQDFLINL